MVPTNSNYIRDMTLRILLIRDPITKYWTAQCLEYDIAASGKSVRDAQKEFVRVLNVELSFRQSRGENGLEKIKPAPLFYHKLYELEQAISAAREATEKSSFLYNVFNTPSVDPIPKTL